MTAARKERCVLRAIRKSPTARLQAIATQMEKVGLSEYLAYAANTRRFLWRNFLAGIARGVGFAVGASLLGALLVVLLQRLAVANLPLIGDFLAEVVQHVQVRLP